jgi:hypothetical protein
MPRTVRPSKTLKPPFGELGLCRDRARAVRVPDDDVGVRAGGDHALARIHIEDAARVGRRDRTNSDGVSLPLLTPASQTTAMRSSTPPQPFGIFVKSSLAGGLLLGAERAVVGRGGVQVAALQALPQRVLVFLRAERRAHHVAGREIEIGVR